MKISIGSNIINGPWGGGNQFAISLSRYLKNRGWDVTTGLSDGDIDIILMTEPRITSKSGAYNQRQISRYLIKKPDTIVIHRINECDERKGTKGVNKYLMRANRVADYTVFISSYLENLFISNKILKAKNHTFIRNGADETIFNLKRRARWDGCGPLRLVTHHWGANYYKGFDIYEMIDNLVKKGINGLKLEFNYIGNVPEDFNFKNSKKFSPLSGEKLADKIKENHIYVTASMNEPAGMHHIEGAMCGLPLLYRNSGGIPEYAEGFGKMFNGKEDFLSKLKEIIKEYDFYYNKMKKYPYNSILMCSKYEELFCKLLKHKESFNLQSRKRKYRKIYLKEKFIYPKGISIFQKF